MQNVWFQKISILPLRRELKFWRGGGSKAQEIPEGRGIEKSIWFLEGWFDFKNPFDVDLSQEKK